MLIRFFEKLREKSVQERKRYALGLSFGGTFVIFLLWLGIVTHTLPGSRGGSVVTPFQSLGTDVASVGVAVKDRFVSEFFAPSTYEAPKETVSVMSPQVATTSTATSSDVE